MRKTKKMDIGHASHSKFIVGYWSTKSLKNSNIYCIDKHRIGKNTSGSGLISVITTGHCESLGSICDKGQRTKIIQVM